MENNSVNANVSATEAEVKANQELREAIARGKALKLLFPNRAKF